MDPKFRSSFIPKKPLSSKSEGGRVKKRSSFNLMTFIASLVFIVAVVASGGVYAYSFVLQDQIDQKGIELTEARKLLNLQQIDNYKLLDERLSTAWTLFRDHKITSSFFTLLEDTTLHNVQFNSYRFESSDGESELQISLIGQASDFNALALQADVFERQNLIRDTEFESIEILEDKSILFTLKTHLDSEEVAFITN